MESNHFTDSCRLMNKKKNHLIDNFSTCCLPQNHTRPSHLKFQVKKSIKEDINSGK